MKKKCLKLVKHISKIEPPNTVSGCFLVSRIVFVMILLKEF